MITKTSVLAVICLLLAPFMAGAELMPRVSDAAAQELIRDAVEKEKRAPGIVAALIDEKGTKVIAWGTLHAGGSQKVDGNTLFQIGSITKVFTTLLLQDMVDHGEVKLTDPISKFLPSSVKTPTRDGKEITLLHLATHTSGLPRLPFSLWYGVWHMKDIYAGFRVKDFYKFLSKHKLERDIGAQFEYSNAGMQLLGHVLALNAKTNYEALVLNRICKPLGMNSTYVVLPAELTPRLAGGHVSKMKPVAGWNPSDFPGAGELRSSVNDLSKFLSANMGLMATTLSNSMQATHGSVGKVNNGVGEVGLGWMINKRSNLIWHNGGMLGYVSYMAFNPTERRGVVVLANGMEGVDDLGEILMGARELRKIAPISPAVFKPYAGKYRFDAKKVMKVKSRSGKFFVQVTGQPKFEIFPESDTEFFCKKLDAQAKFVREGGVIKSLIWYQNGSKGTEMVRLK